MRTETSTSSHRQLLKLVVPVVVVVVIGLAAYYFFTTVVARRNYWDGGKYAGRAVLQPLDGMTWEAHQELAKCGLDDSAGSHLYDVFKTGSGQIVDKDGRKIIMFDGSSPLFSLKDANIYGIGSISGNNVTIDIARKNNSGEPYKSATIKGTSREFGILEIICVK
jgi:hypothetical protein